MVISWGWLSVKDLLLGDLIDPALQIKLHTRDKITLEHLKENYGGKLYGPYMYNKRDSCLLTFRGRDLVVLLTLFDKYLPNSHKYTQYLSWKLKYNKRLTKMILNCENILNSL